MKTARFATAVSITLLSSGCSFVFVSNPPSEPPERNELAAEECTPKRTWPWVDVVGVPVSAVNAVYFAESDDFTTDQKRILTAAHISYGVLFAASAVYGFVATGRCAELRREVGYDPNRPAGWSPARKK